VYDDGAVDLEKLSLPPRGVGEIDVAMSTAAICGSDLHTVLGHRSTPDRTALGHEGIGEVLDLDNDVHDLRGERLAVGDRVVFALFSACGSCDRCSAGLAMKCRNLLKYGHESVTTAPHATGTLADVVRLLPGVAVLKVPAEVDDRHVVAAGCAVATAAAVVTAAGPPAAGTRALVYGAGAVGSYTAAMLASIGVDVAVSDPNPDRQAAVTALGLRLAADDAPAYDLVIEASGSPVAFTEAIDRIEIGGRIVAAGAVSPGHSTVTFDPATLVRQRLSLIGVHNYTAEEFRYGVDWLLAHGQRPEWSTVLSAPFPLDDVERAFAEIQRGRFLRVLVQPGSDA